MITSAELTELQSLIDGVHSDPHHVLGMHSLLFNNKQILTVRAMIPQAVRISAFDPLQPDKRYPLAKVHVEGFFEGMITDRNKWFRYMLEIENADGNIWECYDPYSFYPTINETDRYLFCEGTHYEIFNKFGAHLTELEGVSGALFVVWVPEAARVSVIGEFNCWDGRRAQMRNIAGAGIWEIFIPGLQELDEYKYEIKRKNGAVFQKCDPYGFYMTHSPGTQSILFDIDKYQWNDGEWLNTRARHDRVAWTEMPINIYEVHPGSWRQPASYDDMAESLSSYARDMGFTHIELTPVQEHGNQSSLGYHVTGYYAPTSLFGQPDGFAHFVDKCHQAGIGVILDWVPTQFPPDYHSLIRFNGTELYESSDPGQGVHPVWGTLMFDYSKKEVKNFLLGNALFWIEKYHIDGLRINNLASILYSGYRGNGMYGDSVNHGALEFVKHLNSIIEKRHPDVIMIAEDCGIYPNVTRPVNNGGLGFTLKWDIGWMQNFLARMSIEPERRLRLRGDLPDFIECAFGGEAIFDDAYMYAEKIILPISHDESAYGKKSIIERMPGDVDGKFANLRMTLALMMTRPGKKLVFMGLEFGQSSPWNIEKSLDWDMTHEDRNQKLMEYVRDLNYHYKKDRALWELDFDKNGFELFDSRTGIISFKRKSLVNKDITIIICNFTLRMVPEYELSVPYGGSFKEIINSDSKAYGGSGMSNRKLSAKKDDGGGYKLKIMLPALSTIIIKPVLRKRRTI